VKRSRSVENLTAQRVILGRCKCNVRFLGGPVLAVADRSAKARAPCFRAYVAAAAARWPVVSCPYPHGSCFFLCSLFLLSLKQARTTHASLVYIHPIILILFVVLSIRSDIHQPIHDSHHSSSSIAFAIPPSSSASSHRVRIPNPNSDTYTIAYDQSHSHWFFWRLPYSLVLFSSSALAAQPLFPPPLPSSLLAVLPGLYLFSGGDCMQYVPSPFACLASELASPRVRAAISAAPLRALRIIFLTISYSTHFSSPRGRLPNLSDCLFAVDPVFVHDHLALSSSPSQLTRLYATILYFVEPNQIEVHRIVVNRWIGSGIAT